MIDQFLPYSGAYLDRANHLRDNVESLSSVLQHAATIILPLWNEQYFVKNHQPVFLSNQEIQVVQDQVEFIFLGVFSEGAVFAVDLSQFDERFALTITKAEMMNDVRQGFSQLSSNISGMLAYARGLFYWQRQQQFCGACGEQTVMQLGGHGRVCSKASCGRQHYPKIEPAVITLVEAPVISGTERRCLLGRHKGASKNHYALLAGFVDIGESLEDTVQREVIEETGILVNNIRYQASQPWPFPASLMIGFRAQAVTEVIQVDQDELEFADWFTLQQVSHLTFNQDSIEYWLIQKWLKENK